MLGLQSQRKMKGIESIMENYIGGFCFELVPKDYAC
jgi:hypothetical protein